MAGVSVVVVHILDDSRPERVEMDVTDKFGEIGIFLTDDRLIPILEELAMAVVSPVERYCVAGKETGHDGMERGPACLYEKMGVIPEQGPGVTGSVGVDKDLPYPFNEPVFIHVIAKDQRPFNAAHDDVVQNSFRIETGMTRHSLCLSEQGEIIKSYLLIYGRPSVLPSVLRTYSCTYLIIMAKPW